MGYGIGIQIGIGGGLGLAWKRDAQSRIAFAFELEYWKPHPTNWAVPNPAVIFRFAFHNVAPKSFDYIRVHTEQYNQCVDDCNRKKHKENK